MGVSRRGEEETYWLKRAKWVRMPWRSATSGTSPKGSAERLLRGIVKGFGAPGAGRARAEEMERRRTARALKAGMADSKGATVSWLD